MCHHQLRCTAKSLAEKPPVQAMAPRSTADTAHERRITARYRTTAIGGVQRGTFRVRQSTTSECLSRTHDQRIPGHAPRSCGGTTTTRAAIRVPVSLPFPDAPDAGTSAGISRLARNRPGNKNIGRRLMSVAPAPPNRRPDPGSPACTVWRRDRPNPGRPKRSLWEPLSHRDAWAAPARSWFGWMLPLWVYGERMILPVVARPASCRCASPASDRAK